MKINDLKLILKNNPNKEVLFIIDDYQVPQHYHLTEVGRVHKKFIDCGGTKRESVFCVLQLWVANDKEHRLISDKMSKILEYSNEILENENLSVFVEYEKDVISQYPITGSSEDDSLIFYLGKKHTKCLAPDKCGVSCCSEVFDLS